MISGLSSHQMMLRSRSINLLRKVSHHLRSVGTLKFIAHPSVCTLCYNLSGVILRDSHGVAQVKLITGNKILRILKSKGGVFLFVLIKLLCNIIYMQGWPQTCLKISTIL